MNRPRWWLVVPALLASAVLSAASAAEIRDKAGLFSPDAVKKAQAELDRLEKSYAVPVTIETIETLDGDTIAQVTNRHAQAVNAEGVYILIPKKEHKILAESSKHYREYLTRSRMATVEKAFETKFIERDFDGGLNQAVAKLETVFTDAKTDSGGTIRQSTAPNARRGGVAVPARKAPVPKTSSGGFSLITIILGILAIFFVIRIFSALMGAMRGNQYGPGGGGMMGGRGGYPGPGGPGYGGGGYGGAPGGGGGFMSSMFGGIGGALAGNWLYDKMSGNQHGGYTDQTGYDSSASAAPVEDTSPEWSGNDAGTDWGGGDGATTDAPAGGDWGGGGGGNDWGGGGGDTGGDWGGGGGGDDNGGSW